MLLPVMVIDSKRVLSNATQRIPKRQNGTGKRRVPVGQLHLVSKEIVSLLAKRDNSPQLTLHVLLEIRVNNTGPTKRNERLHHKQL